MNKIFKVVWSKARNCYVVVSEVAKANGKSSVKSIAAALAVAVMMSGGVMSAEAATYVEAQGSIITVTQNTQNPVKDYVTGNGERVVGGWNSMSGVTATTLNSNITVTGGEYNMIVGGNYTGTATDMTVQTTNVVIDGATVKQLIGGTGFNGVTDSDNAADRTTNVTIKSGTFGNVIDNTNCPEMHVVAGDLVKTGNGTQNTTATLAQTNLTVSGGEFDAAVYGGSAAIRYYGGYTSGDVAVTVDEANVTITGGTFNDAIAAGGLAWGHETDSLVKEANLTVSGQNGNLNINNDIYAGGLDGSLRAGYESAISKVEKATVNIDNATVNNVYGSGGNIDTVTNATAVKYGTDYDWKYKQNTDADAIVDTDLTLENVTANIVDVQKGSITLKGDNTVEAIKAGAEATVTMSGTGGELTAKVDASTFDMGNGNTWNVTDNSTMTSLKGTDASLVQGAANEVIVSVNKPGTGSAMTGATMNVGEGVTLAVSSDDRTGNGIVRDVNISGDGNLEITSDKAWFGLGYGQNEIDVDQLKIELTDGDTWGAIYSDNLSTGDHIVKANDAQLISGNDAVHNQGPHNIMVDVENKLEIIAEDGYGVMNASQNDNKIDLTAETIEITSKDRTAVKVGHEVGDTGYNGTVNIGDADTKNITIKGAAQNPAGGNERKSAAVYTQGGGTVNLSAAENITIENTNNVTAKGAAIGAYDGGTINVDGNAGVVDVKGQVVAAIGTTVTVEGKTVSVTSKEDSIDTWGGTVDIDATESINITSSEKDGIQTDDATVTLKGKNVTVAGGAWGIKNIDETNSNVVVDGTNVTIKGGTDADEGAIWAMGAGDGEVTVNATGTADIQGEVNVDIGAAVTLKGGTVNVAGGAEDALDACGGTIDVDATNINITSEKNDGIQANDATITLDGENVTIDAGNWAIKNLDETDSDVTINATGDVTIKGDAGAITTSENGSGSVTVNGMGTTTIEGNIKAASNGNVSVLLNTADSLLDGDVTTTNGTTTITMNDGATWKVTGTSNVSEIAGAKGTIMVDTVQDGLVTIGNNTNADLTLNIADGGNIGVDVEEGLKEMVKTVDVKQGNGINNLVVDEFTLKAAAKEVDGKVTTTIKPGDEFVVESDVIATGDVKAAGDVFAGDVSLQDTKAQADANAKDIAANKEAIARGDVVNRVQNTQIAQLQSKDIELGNAISDETAARKAADKALQTQIDTNAADIATNATNIAANAAGIQQNTNAIAGLNNRVTSLDGRVDKVGAGAAALAALHPLDYDAENKLSFSAGVGNYAGQTAAAVGAFYRPNEDVMFSIGGTAGNGENMVNAGVSFAIGKGSSGVAKMSKAELVQEVTNMKAENEELKQENKDIRNELNKLKELVMKLAEK